MILINLKKYKYLGTQDKWYRFQSKIYTGLDVQILHVRQAKVVLEDGSYLYLDPIQKEDIIRIQSGLRCQRLLRYKELLQERSSVVEGE